ncbi:MAG: Cys-Gln thioester bond-forming surface protein [Clostridia bacterium]|nr:Cys-Gln thioester bond-forming surface protein [Clostridia bacterium]MCI9413347.1 Cys-Gln thioester bond-forming surface protein [Clostridia bacterium]
MDIQHIVLVIGKDGVEEAGNYRVNIEKLLQDVKSKDIDYIQIWRTIVNGYPYKSPEELGVDTVQEAYFVTKQAIYCVMLNRSMDVYRGVTEKGNRNVKAIEKLRDIGLNGTQIPPVAGLKVEKSGEWQEEGANYAQAYTVKANVDISQYEVSSLKENGKGIFISDANGKAKQSFKGGEIFKINIPKSQANQKIDIEFTVKAKCKTYPIFYGETTIPGTQNYAITYSEYRRFCSKCEINCQF